MNILKYTTLTALATLACLPFLFATQAFAADAGGGAHRMAGDIDSWVALMILISSFAVAILLNAARPAVRVGGTLLAALGCFAIVAWFAWAYSTSFVSHPRPHVIPVDAAKPTLLTIQAAIAFVGGVVLLGVARWQARRTDILDLPHANTGAHYGRVSRYLHWSIAILMLVLVPMGIFASMIPEGTSFRIGYYVAHKTLGFCVLALVVARLVWHFRGGRPPLDGALKTWERRLAHTTHVFLYVLMIGLPLSGFIMSTYGGKLSHFFIWDLPLLWQPNEQALLITGLMHKVVWPYLLYIFLGAHILGALKHQLIDKHATALRRMVS